MTTVTASGPVTSSGGATPNIALTSPSRGYGQGSAATLTTSPQTVADVLLVPSNTGKLQISAWCIVNSADESEQEYVVGISDGTHVLFESAPITIAAGGTSTFAVTIDSDLPTGNGTTPATYLLGSPVTISLVLAELGGSTGDLTLAQFGSGILVKENVV